MTPLDQAIIEAAEAFVVTVTTPGANPEPANDRLFHALEIAGGLVELDGEQLVRRSTLVEVRDAIHARARFALVPLYGEDAADDALQSAVAMFETKFPIKRVAG